MTQLPSAYRYLYWVLLVSTLLLFLRPVHAATYYVRSDGDDSNSGTGSDTANAWATVVGAATKTLAAGDIICVQAGNYSGTVIPTVDGVSGNPIRFIADSAGSVSGWSAGTVLLQASASSNCLDSSRAYLHFTGFTFDGDSNDDALDVKTGSGLVFEKCEVFGGYRGVVLDSGATATFINCIIRNNANDGLAIVNGTATVYHCTIVANVDDGIDTGNDSATVINCIIANNNDFGFSRQSDGDGTLIHFYNLLYNNTSGNYSGTTAGAGELSVDPLFAGVGDYHLQNTSPASEVGVDLSGIVDDDFDSATRPQRSGHDMGAFEVAALPSTYYVRTDGNNSNSGTDSTASEAWATVVYAATQPLPAGSIIYVQAGTYAGSIVVGVDGSVGNPIQFEADTQGTTSGWSAGKVILQADSSDKVLEIDSDDYVEFHGFTLQGDSGNHAVDIDFGQGVVLSRCEIYGGSNGVQTGNGADTTIVNCLIRDNVADGISVTGGTATIWNTSVVHNTSDGIEQHNGVVTITNSIFAFNGSDGLDLNSGTMTHSYNLVFGNASDDFEGTVAATGEITQDPLFAGPNSYFLKDLSPAINTGTNAAGTADEDLVATVRPLGAGWDLGCYEGSGLLGHWKLDETTGTNAADSSHNGNDGVYTNGVTVNVSGPYPGEGATAAEFDGTNDHVELPAIDASFSGGMTIAAWIQPDATLGSGQFHEILDLSNGSQVDQILLSYNGSAGLQLFLTDTADGSSISTIEDNTGFTAGRWVHCVATIDSSGYGKIYRNGKVTKSGFFTSFPTNVSRSTATIGKSSFGEHFGGGLQDVRFYHRELIAAEIADLYGLVGHWKLDETSGTVAADSSGVDADGTLDGATPGVAGTRSYATEFDGSNDRITIPANTAHDATEGVSMAAWVKVDSFGDVGGGIFCRGDSNHLVYGMRVKPNGQLHWANSYGSLPDATAPYKSLHSASALTLNRWHQVVETWDGSEVKFYIDGKLDMTSALSGQLGVTTEASNIGADTPGGNEWMDGSIDDVVLYNRAMSEAEIAEHYGLVGHWRMEEASGSVVSDSSGMGNHGTIVGTPGWSTDAKEAFGALELDGTSYVEVPSLVVDDASDGITVSGWVNLSAADTDGAELITLSDAFGISIDSSSNPGVTAFAYNGTGWNEAASARIVEGAGWTHFSASYNPFDMTLRLYINGVLKAKETLSSPPDLTGLGSTTRIGTHGGSQTDRDLTGIVDDIRVYNRPITRKEASALYYGKYVNGLRIIEWAEVQNP